MNQQKSIRVCFRLESTVFNSRFIYRYSSDSGCPFPRNANNTIASVIATPIAVPYATIPASAVIRLMQD